MRLQPEEILRILERHRVRYVIIGGVGATLHGSPLPTHDTDVCPARDSANLQALATALRQLRARIRAPGVPDGLPFACEAAFIQQMDMLNLTTSHGDLDISFEPSGTHGYEDLARSAAPCDLGDGLVVSLASLEDIIRSKEAANREKDRMTLPTLRLLLQKRREQLP